MVSLYRKWRSRSFDDLLGQDGVVRTLRNAVAQNRVAHAYLFTGPRGTGKTSTARILAKAVNCLQPKDGNPCNDCDMCNAANEGRAFDVIEIDAASNTSVDNVRELRERVGYAASEGQFKVYIVDEVHRLSGAAFDAFLKTLEEPPPHVIFVFASTEPHKVPETITSRCQRFDFRRISSTVTLDRLRYVAAQEGISVDVDALRLITLHAHGSLRDALGLLDQVASFTPKNITDAEVRDALGLPDAALLASLSDCLLKGEVGEGLGLIHTFVQEGGDSRQLTRDLVEYWRALLLAVTNVSVEDLPLDPALTSALDRHKSQLDHSKVVDVLRALIDQDFGTKFNFPPQLPLEVGYVQAALALQTQKELASAPKIELPVAQKVQESTRDLNEEPQNPTPVQEESPPLSASPMPSKSTSGATDIETAWPAVVASMRTKSPSLQAVLRSGHVMKTEGDEITIGFEFPFHRTQFTDTKKRRLLEEVVGEVLGSSYRVNCVLTTREELESLKGPGAVETDDGFIEEVAERLRDFHARQLGNGHS